MEVIHFIIFMNIIISIYGSAILNRQSRHIVNTLQTSPNIIAEKSHNAEKSHSGSSFLIKDAKDLIICGVDKCQQIKEFTIADNSSINCYEQYLPISFDIISENKTHKYFGYLPEGHSQISLTQLTKRLCKKYKK